LQEHHNLQLPVSALLRSLRTLSEQSYENKALTFGSILDPQVSHAHAKATFPDEFLRSKRYKALSDGFRTAYIVTTEGRIADFVELDQYAPKKLTAKHFYPDWAEPIARASRSKKCGIVLSRQGDILVFDEGTLRFTYRFGLWQYWNHVHLVRLIRDRAKAQRVPPKQLAGVVRAIYRAALDVSFRRSGGLFVILHSRKNLRQIVRMGDAIGDAGRAATDADFDRVVANHFIQSLPRPVAVELASLDGAVVLANSGQILAYGAVLNPQSSSPISASEGSRTKAAIGASYSGLTLKISSDGDITVYHKGDDFIRV
jgi:hypothetical protein